MLTCVLIIDHSVVIGIIFLKKVILPTATSIHTKLTEITHDGDKSKNYQKLVLWETLASVDKPTTDMTYMLIC